MLNSFVVSTGKAESERRKETEEENKGRKNWTDVTCPKQLTPWSRALV